MSARGPSVADAAPDHKKTPAMFTKQNSASKKLMGADHQKRINCITTCNFRLPNPSVSPMKYLRNLGGKMAQFFRKSHKKKGCPKVTSSSSSISEKPKPSVAAPILDSQRAEAIDDCIEFINSSSSLPRSNSVADH